MDYLINVLDFHAIVENPLVSFNILKGDLKFFVSEEKAFTKKNAFE